jgi:hypothetical protein
MRGAPTAAVRRARTRSVVDATGDSRILLRACNRHRWTRRDFADESPQPNNGAGAISRADYSRTLSVRRRAARDPDELVAVGPLIGDRPCEAHANRHRQPLVSVSGLNMGPAAL